MVNPQLPARSTVVTPCRGEGVRRRPRTPGRRSGCGRRRSRARPPCRWRRSPSPASPDLADGDHAAVLRSHVGPPALGDPVPSTTSPPRITRSNISAPPVGSRLPGSASVDQAGVRSRTSAATRFSRFRVSHHDSSSCLARRKVELDVVVQGEADAAEDLLGGGGDVAERAGQAKSLAIGARRLTSRPSNGPTPPRRRGLCPSRAVTASAM